MAGPVSQKGIEDKENNRTQDGNKGRHPAKRENNTMREPQNTRRLWGYKGIRIGEASHPGPGMNEDTEIYEGKRGMAMGEAFKEAAELFKSHRVWKGDNLTRKGNSTGMRLATLNFNRKLYVSYTNINQALDGMEKLELAVLIGVKPGQGSLFNSARIQTLARNKGMEAKLLRRSHTGSDGGIVMITNKEWSKIPHTEPPYRTDKGSLNGRVMSIVFDNKEKEGDHRKIQVIAVHLLNSANNNSVDSARLLKRISGQKRNFAIENPKAPSMVIGGLDAAEDEYLDTNTNQALNGMVKLELDVLRGVEQGQASLFNSARIQTLARNRGMEAKLIRRSHTGSDRGIVTITNKEWSKTPYKITPYRTDKASRNKEGDHRKIQVIAIHLLNSANNNSVDSTKLLK